MAGKRAKASDRDTVQLTGNVVLHALQGMRACKKLARMQGCFEEFEQNQNHPRVQL